MSRMSLDIFYGNRLVVYLPCYQWELTCNVGHWAAGTETIRLCPNVRE